MFVHRTIFFKRLCSNIDIFIQNLPLELLRQLSDNDVVVLIIEFVFFLKNPCLSHHSLVSLFKCWSYAYIYAYLKPARLTPVGVIVKYFLSALNKIKSFSFSSCPENIFLAQVFRTVQYWGPSKDGVDLDMRNLSAAGSTETHFLLNYFALFKPSSFQFLIFYLGRFERFRNV